jgi:hypothetical protein
MNMNQNSIIQEMKWYKEKVKAHSEKIKLVNRDIKVLMDIKRKHSKEKDKAESVVSYLAEQLNKEVEE